MHALDHAATALSEALDARGTRARNPNGTHDLIKRQALRDPARDGGTDRTRHTSNMKSPACLTDAAPDTSHGLVSGNQPQEQPLAGRIELLSGSQRRRYDDRTWMHVRARSDIVKLDPVRSSTVDQRGPRRRNRIHVCVDRARAA